MTKFETKTQKYAILGQFLTFGRFCGTFRPVQTQKTCLLPFSDPASGAKAWLGVSNRADRTERDG